ncbi:MAG: DUF4350 domain-containing protein [Ferruginibacter sp.]
MKPISRHIIFSLLIAAVLTSCSNKTSLPDLRETYGYRDTRPFGGSIAYTLLRNAYPAFEPELVKEQFGDNYWEYDTATVYVNVSRNFYVEDEDAEELLDYVYKGNTAFIAAENIDTILLRKIFCTQKSGPGFFMPPEKFRNTSLRFTRGLTLYKDSFSYFYRPFKRSFPEINGAYSRIAGYNDAGQTNFFVFFWGKGRLYLHSEPRAFSNYFLLTNNNYRYMQEILQMLPASPENIYWDNFHTTKNYAGGKKDGSFSTFSTLLRYPALAKAFFIALGLLLLYILFNSKRRQRVIPVIKPPENTSIAFAEAIAGLYLNKKDNRLIAEKMINYFNEHTRSKYFFHMNVQDAGYEDMLSRKSGVPSGIIQPLTEIIRTVSTTGNVQDQQLLELNGLIEKFFKHKS